MFKKRKTGLMDGRSGRESDGTGRMNRIAEKISNWAGAERQDSRLLDVLFSTALAAFLLHVHGKLIAWYSDYKIIGNVGAMVLLDICFFVSLLYITISVLMRQSGRKTLLALLGFLVLSMYLWAETDYDLRCRAAGIFFMLAARGRDYRKILMVWLAVFLVSLAAALTSVAGGLAYIQEKHQNYPVGYAFGYIHTNNGSRILFWIAMLLWLLIRKKNPGIPVLLFGTAALIAAFHTRCRTILLLSLLMLAAAEAVQGRKKAPGKISAAIAAGSPFLCLFLSIALSYAVVPLIPRFRHSVLWNMFSRFVQNNIALREYGVHLTGHWIDFLGDVSRVFNGETIFLRILDNAYVPWLIRNGIPVTLAVLFVYSLSIRKAVRNGNLCLTLVFLCIAVYGLMEPATMQFHYNFAFIYLLAKEGEVPYGGDSARRETDHGEASPDAGADGGAV